MGNAKRKKRIDIVYSTDDNFEYEYDEIQEEETLPANQQTLKVTLDKKMRRGKVVTLIEGFIGTQDDLSDLAKFLKQKCGVGGSAKNSQIIIQGDFKEKIQQLLKDKQYKVK